MPSRSPTCWPPACPVIPSGRACWRSFLKRVVVKTVRMEDFRPAKSMVERGEIEHVVGEFRRFLEAAAGGEGATSVQYWRSDKNRPGQSAERAAV